MKIEYKRDDIKTVQGGKKEMTIGICDDEIKCVEAAMACCEKVKEEINQKFEYRIFCKGEELLEYAEVCGHGKKKWLNITLYVYINRIWLI